MRRLSLVFVSMIFGVGCGASGDAVRVRQAALAGSFHAALAVYERERAHDGELLVALAEGLLERDARGANAELRRAAFAELGATGLGAGPLLLRLQESDEADVVRALALAARMQLGDGDARAALRALADHEDPGVADLACGALDAVTDKARLMVALLSPRTSLRLAALSVLARATATIDAELRAALGERARRDPAPQARSAAVFALAGQGPAAFDAVELALDDPDPNVQRAAATVLPHMELSRAEARLSKWLDGGLRAASLEAACALLRAGTTTEAARAQRVLRLALEASDGALRARAAVLLRTLPERARELPTVRAQLAKETVRETRLVFSLALPDADPAALAALRALSQEPTVAGVAAAGSLVQRGESAALAVLQRALAHASAAVRRSAARALGGILTHPHELRLQLADADPSVRRVAAAAVLRVTARSAGDR